MTLPGKLCIGILEEDNPQKSYFRFKPLLLANGEVFEKYEEPDEFPENGCIRIVPDKNESSRFKARMRRMGGFCVVDLREHPDENDKIRPNKNYHGDESEPNAYIIYSDVVREPGEGQIVEIVAQDAPDDAVNIALTLPTPRTARVLMRAGGDVCDCLWSHAPIAEIEGGVAFTRTDCKVEMAAAQRFDIPGFGEETLSFFIAAPGKELFTPDAQPVPAPITAPRQAAHPERPAQEVAPEAESRAEKPWITRDARVVPRPVDPRLSPREQEIALQTGINPRRGRSLKEVIEDKWRRSRIDQLGHPVPGSVMGKPVISPVDRAVDAVREAWDHLDARACLAQALSGVDGLMEAIASGEDAREVEERAVRLREYEEARTALSAEIERLRRERDGAKEELVRELRAESAAEIADHAARVKALETRAEELRARAEDASRIAEAAERSIAELTNEKLQARLSEFAINARALDLIALARSGGAPTVAAPARQMRRVDAMGVNELAARVRGRFAAAGFDLTEDEAVNLLALFALPGELIVTGPTGCGKTAHARLLSDALGILGAGRFLSWNGAGEPPVIEDGELPTVLFLDDLNAEPGVCRSAVSRLDAAQPAKVIMVARDSGEGEPLPARLLDRAFFLRLSAERLTAPWTKPARAFDEDDVVLTRAALRALFVPSEHGVSQQVARRMRALRDELARHGVLLSRRTLDGLWLYCATVTPYLSLTPLETFDLAFAQRALPAVVAMAGVELLHAIPAVLEGMPRSLELLKQPLAIEV